ncbi:alpha/beta hydrolase [Gemella cuniculi]|uniref:alpha/beta hydrolase n=1 Tax=Gemella cuniculi TaxID=150240 RepID=UPI00041E50D1|nr:hypothetical protein [Gemella cuniculi]
MFNEKSTLSDVITYPKFKDFGELIFPVDLNLNTNITLKELSSSLPWYSYVNTKRSLSIINEFEKRVDDGEKIFYSIYSEEEIKKDSRKKYTGLFYFRGNKNNKVAIVNAGGGFQYVGAIHDSFPHCQKLAQKGYNAFALIYRPGVQTACEDLARAIAFLHENKKNLEIDMRDYSLWGGSAGARLATWIGTHGTKKFGEKYYPKPSVVIM